MTPDNQPALPELLESLCAWLLHRFGPNSPEGREATVRLESLRRAEGATLEENEDIFDADNADAWGLSMAQQEVTPTAQRVAAGDERPRGFPQIREEAEADDRDQLMFVRGYNQAIIEAEDALQRRKPTPPPTGEAVACSCPSGDGSLRWPCQAHPSDQSEPAAWGVKADGVYGFLYVEHSESAAKKAAVHGLNSRIVPLYTHPAAQAEGRGVDVADVRELLEWIFRRFGAPWDASELPDHLVPVIRRMESAITAPADVGGEKSE